MADRRVKLILEAQVDQFNRRMQEASRQSEGLGSSLREAVNRPELQQLGRHLAGFGTATVGALGMATKSAIDWETAWTDVMRRTEGTPQQLENLETALRGIATELPTTHQEVAEVAASAAQLGVAVDDVEEFTRVMIDMGVSTNLTADQAATAMARFSNIMGTPVDEMSNLGSAIVDLGNNSATTESEIMDMATRLAGAGDQAGLSEGEVLGLAAAMSSLGIRSQAGGTALTRTMNTIGLEVDTGGEKLETFAETAGMTSEEFATAWRDDAASALLAFVEGLGNAEERGMSMNEVLQDLGITSEREADVLRRLASDVDLTADALDRGTSAYEENTAMAQEAGYVYDTVASQLKAFWSNINDAAIELGQAFLPALEATVDWLSQAVTWFSELSPEVQAASGWIAAIAGSTSLAAGSFLLLAPGIIQSVDALRRMSRQGGRARGVIGGLGRAAGLAAIGIVAMEIASAGANREMEDGMGTSDDYKSAIERLADGNSNAKNQMDELANSSSWLGGELIDVGHMFNTMDTNGFVRTLQSPLGQLHNLTGGMVGVKDTLYAAKGAASEFDTAFAQLVEEGNVDAVAEGMRYLADEAESQGVIFSNWAREHLPELSDALDGAGTNMDEFMNALGMQSGYVDAATGEWEQGSISMEEFSEKLSASEEDAIASALGVEELDDALGGMGESAEEAALSLSELTTQLVEAGIINRDARAAARDYEASLDALTTSIEENGYTLDTSTQAGRNNEAAFDAIADAGIRSAQAMADNGASQEELQDSLSGTYGDLVTAAEKFGITGKEAHEMAAEILGVPDSVEVTSDMDETAQNIAEWLNSELDEVERPRLATILAESNTGIAESDLTEAARERIADIIAEPDSVTAEGELTDTARKRIADILADSDTWDAEADFNETARDRIADIFADPDSYNAEGELNDTARSRIADIMADPDSYNAEGDLNETARDRVASITGSASTGAAERALNYLARNRSSTLTVTQVTRMANTGASAGRPAGYSTGGSVHGPGTGTSDSIPALLSNGEHVLTTRDVAALGGQAGVYNFRSNLHGSQRPSGRDMVPGYAAGGAVQARQLAAAMSSSAHTPAPAMPSELTGTLYMESGAMLGQVRMAMKDPGVARAASQSLAQQGRRDGRAG